MNLEIPAPVMMFWGYAKYRGISFWYQNKSYLSILGYAKYLETNLVYLTGIDLHISSLMHDKCLGLMLVIGVNFGSGAGYSTMYVNP